METQKDIAAKILDEARARIVENMRKHYENEDGAERWVTASGRSARAFSVEVDGSIIRLVYEGGDNVAPLESLERGYKGDADPSDLMEWYRVKTGGIEVSEATAAGWAGRIRDEGTERYRHPIDWIFSPVIQDAAEKLAEELPTVAIGEIYRIIDEARP